MHYAKSRHKIDSFLINLSQETKKNKISWETNLTGEISRIGLRVPAVRKVLKNKLFLIEVLALNQLSPREQLGLWDYVWKNTSYYESMSLALYFYQKKALTKGEFAVIDKWILRCTCWEHSDDLSKIYAQLVEEHPTWILPTLKRWNRSKNSWKRRQSLVSLIEYASKRKQVLPFDKLISFIIPLLNDNEYYVQKGLGWTVREIYNVYPLKTLQFLSQYLFQISSVAYSAAVEKLDKDTRDSFRQKRKEDRIAKKVLI